jgi:tripartite-type tricarboxylate transporter receptor subunit TctC
MPTSPNHLRRSFLGAVALAPWIRPAVAAKYPSAPVRFIVPFTAGSASDLIARIYSERLTATLGQGVVVENRPGAGGTIGAAFVAKAPPDGLNLAVVGIGHLVNPVLYKNLPYDTLKDFAGIAPLGSFPNVLVVPPELGIKTVRDLIARAKAKPGSLAYGTAGIGSAAHINMQKMLNATGIDALHVPLKGANDILSETLAGRCQFSWAPLGPSLGMVKSGKLLALAISSAKRSALLPGVPTISEAGVEGAEFTFWVGLLAPAKTPRDIVEKLNSEIQNVEKLPAVQERFNLIGAEGMPMSTAQFDSLIKTDYVSLGRIMRGAARS